ncbi:hypothetical protein FOZ63_016240 [Perkinsus olseni]|uniref:Methyltransferase type 11 domain-containing protein n=1 Tax=Perkinsus olseni TaxID=32597 RepID=A0A7J6QMY7_PEROL|nr:hypothetical protein FOZ63_016240 [Perkinsus olseni]
MGARGRRHKRLLIYHLSEMTLMVLQSPYDFVIASDMLFSSKIAREVFAACRRLIKPGGTILLGHEKRYSVYRDAETGEIRQESVDQPLQVFLGLSREENWSVQEVSPFPNEPNLIALRVDCI